MAYIMLRDVVELKLKQGQKLDHEFGKLPAALEFSARWQESGEEQEEKPENESELKKELKAVKTELTKTKKLVDEKDEKIAELEKLLAEVSNPADNVGDAEQKSE